MLTKVNEMTEAFIAAYSAGFNEAEWMKELRLDSFRKYKQMGFPEMKYGTGIIMDMSGLDIENWSIRPEVLQSDVIYNKDITSVKIHRSDDSIKELLGSLVKPENKLLALHYALFDGFIVIIPKNKKFNEPIKISTFLENEMHFNHFLIIIGDGAEVDILEDSIDYGRPGLKTNVVEMFIGKEAKVNYIMTQKLNDGVYNFTTRRAVLGKDSKLNWLGCTLGSRFSQIENTSILKEEGAESNNYGIFIGMNEEQFDFFNNVRHEAPHTNSEILTRGIVKDKSKSLCRGSIEIKKNAHSCDAFQRADTLMLSKGAEADAVPELKIDNNDVKCSHGSTIGQVDEEKMFYLMTRGLNEQEARKTIVQGFLEPTISKMKHIDHLKDDIEKRIK